MSSLGFLRQGKTAWLWGPNIDMVVLESSAFLVSERVAWHVTESSADGCESSSILEGGISRNSMCLRSGLNLPDEGTGKTFFLMRPQILVGGRDRWLENSKYKWNKGMFVFSYGVYYSKRNGGGMPSADWTNPTYIYLRLLEIASMCLQKLRCVESRIQSGSLPHLNGLAYFWQFSASRL